MMKFEISSKFSPCQRDTFGNPGNGILFIEAIKVVRDLTQLGLKEAKDLVEEIFTRGSSHTINLITQQQMSPSATRTTIGRFNVVGINAIDVGSGELEAFRVSARRMIATALEADNISLASDILELYKKHFTR